MTYPTNRLLAVIDDPSAANAVAEQLARAGFNAEVLRDTDGIEKLRGTGRIRTRWTKIVRVFQFMSMDQGPDLHIYEAALRDGRAVIAVVARGRQAIDRAAAILRQGGAHFLNHFGRFQTEEIAPWRGPEPALPDYLRR